MMNQYDLIVIGGGASGLIAAITAAERGAKVLVLEKNDRIGRKILASGNGRCNMLNVSQKVYYGDEAFAEKVLDLCPAKQIISFFNYYGLFTTEETDGRIYPVTYQAASVLNALKLALQINHVEICKQCTVLKIQKEHDLFYVFTENQQCFSSTQIVVSCGGSACQKLGGSPFGYQLLESMGHRIIPPFPALVPIETDRKSISGLSGIRVRCTVSVYQQQKFLHSESGELLFTDYGLSGICIMQCSRFITEKAHVEIDFLSGIFPNEQEAFNEIKRRKQAFPEQSPLVLLDGLLPSKVAFAVLKQAGLKLLGEINSDIINTQLDNILYSAYHYKVQIYGNKGLDHAQVTGGGALCSEFNPATMESFLVPGLYATGEVLNVDGDCGGYNLMFAFSSGMLSGKSIHLPSETG